MLSHAQVLHLAVVRGGTGYVGIPQEFHQKVIRDFSNF